MSTLADKEMLYAAGIERCRQFCALNNIPLPRIERIEKGHRFYGLRTCAFYRGKFELAEPHIRIMVEKCAHRGTGGRAWSWPGYVTDRTPYGVMAHELGHHVDQHLSSAADGKVYHFAEEIYKRSLESPLTSYLGTDRQPRTIRMEWFAEIFRLYVTNPDLCRLLRPRFYSAMAKADAKPLPSAQWVATLLMHTAPSRIIDMARKKIAEARPVIVT